MMQYSTTNFEYTTVLVHLVGILEKLVMKNVPLGRIYNCQKYTTKLSMKSIPLDVQP